MRIKIEDTLFCLVDVQEKLFQHIGNKDELLRTLPILVKGMKTLDVPIIVNEQYKKGIGETIEPLKELVNDSVSERERENRSLMTIYFNSTIVAITNVLSLSLTQSHSDKHHFLHLIIFVVLCVFFFCLLFSLSLSLSLSLSVLVTHFISLYT